MITCRLYLYGDMQRGKNKWERRNLVEKVIPRWNAVCHESGAYGVDRSKSLKG
ncbi:protein of unknown function [[Clostridium] ultunense Esp]|uniref:Uncharacterized protein n=1 Tax=[Clostridium] ultunense Esp TaxID=1288971 RepID=A0A1M4PM32_9FIRM|nr:protein of unknown function [[Clostridium] ultunense Esp]